MADSAVTELEAIAREARGCLACAGELPHVPRPVFRVHSQARILIVGQAPSRRVQETGRPWNDASGARLRDWLGVDERQFHTPELFAILPVGLCYPGKAPGGADRPPIPRCADLWFKKFRRALTGIEMTLAIGTHAQRRIFGSDSPRRLVDRVADWRLYAPDLFPLPHPSPRNAHWLIRHPWFGVELLPALQAAVRRVLESSRD